MLKPTGFAPGVAEARAELDRKWLAEGFHHDVTIGEAIMAGPGTSRLIIRSDTRPVDLSGAEVRDRALLVAGGLAKLGVKYGDAVACQLPTWGEAVFANLGAHLLGAVLVPIVSIYGAKEVGFILRQSKAKVFISPDRWGAFDYVAQRAAMGDLPDLEHHIIVGETCPPKGLLWDNFMRGAEPLKALPKANSSDICLLIYTSGTTADPKGVMHTHRTLNRPRPAAMADAPPAVRLGSLPMGHIGGVGQAIGIATGIDTLVTLDKWAAPAAAQLVEEFKVASTAGTPFFLTTLLEAAKANGNDVSSLTDFALGATAITPADVMACEAVGIRGYRIYGATEHTVSLASSPLLPLEIRANSEGYPPPGTSIRLLDEAGRDVPDGESGEIALIGPQQFVGYSDPSLNAQFFIEGGWFLTGDMGRRDPKSGAYAITDRKKDIIIRGGENISAKEVEDAMASMPAVLEAAAVAMPDPRYGEKICVFVILRGKDSITLEDVRAHFAKTGMARQKTPERVVVVDELPRTPTGKIKKFQLRDQLRGEA